MTLTEPVRSARGPYHNLWIALALLIPAAFVAFVRSYSRGETFSGLTMSTIVHAHAALMTLWLLMLIGQAWFIRTKRYTLHRRVGRSSYVIAPLILIMSIAVAHQTLNRKVDITTLDARFEIYDLMQVIGFGLAWALALVYRRRTPLHVRFMVSTAFAMGNAIVFRILLTRFAWLPGMDVTENVENFDNVAAVNGALLLLMLLALIANDWRLGIRRSPFWLVTVTTLIIHVGFYTFTKTDWWMSLVQWFAGLPF